MTSVTPQPDCGDKNPHARKNSNLKGSQNSGWTEVRNLYATSPRTSILCKTSPVEKGRMSKWRVRGALAGGGYACGFVLGVAIQWI